MTVPTFVIDINHEIIAWNKACELLTGIKSTEVIGTKDAWRGFYSSERPCLANVVLENNIQQLKKYYPINGQSKFSKGLHAENWFENVNGKKRYLIFDAEPIYDEQDGSLIGALENLEDVTDIKQVELREQTHNEVMAQLIKGSPINDIFESLINRIEQQAPFSRCSVLLFDSVNKYLVTAAAPSLPEFYNHSINELKTCLPSNGQSLSAMFSKNRVIAADINTNPLWQNHKEIASVAQIRSCWSEPVFGRDSSFLGVFVIYHDRALSPSDEDLQFLEFASKLTSLTIEQNLLRQQQQLSTRVFSGTLEGIAITNSQGVIIDVNPAFSDITGYDREEVIGSTSSVLSSGKHEPEFYKKMWNSLRDKGHWQGEVWNRKKSGELYAELLSISSLKNERDEVINYVSIFTDITETKQQQEKLNLMAHYDVLTGLPNRVLFLDRFDQSIAHSKRSNTLLAIIFLDLDKFKPVNDTFGHEVGDKLLVEVATRIKSSIRDEDTVSRQGGDEFAILLGDINTVSECEQLAKRIHDSLSTPFYIDNNTIEIGASSGIVLYPREDDDIDTLIRYADQAMYQAKLAGRNRFQLFNHNNDLQTLQKQNKRQDIENALTNNELELYYQPKVNMVSGIVYGFEALIRWIHPERGIVAPLDFLPLIDGTSLEIEIGNWVINQALHQLEKWNQQGLQLELSVNISSHHILSESFYTKLDDALSLYPTVNSQSFQLEILESSALGDIKGISRIIEDCQDELGIKVALDDFGTGYSSLTHLRSLSANTIKIDRSFVRDILADPSDSAIIDGIIGLANAFNRSVIAEGVESTEHGIMLLLMGCNNAQGYGIAKPMPAIEVPRWLRNYKPNKQWLSCAKLNPTDKERKVKLFQLGTSCWLDKFILNINSNIEDITDWPISNRKHCYCGSWIKRAVQDNLFNEHTLSQLMKAHDSTHQLASDIQLCYQSGAVIAAEQLAELKTSFESMNSLLTH